MTTTFAGRLVRGWVALYTDGLPDTVRLARRNEIESDLWSQQEEATLAGRSNASLGVEIVARLVLGIAADLAWRLEQWRLADRTIERSIGCGYANRGPVSHGRSDALGRRDPHVGDHGLEQPQHQGLADPGRIRHADWRVSSP